MSGRETRAEHDSSSSGPLNAALEYEGKGGAGSVGGCCSLGAEAFVRARRVWLALWSDISRRSATRVYLASCADLVVTEWRLYCEHGRVIRRGRNAGKEKEWCLKRVRCVRCCHRVLWDRIHLAQTFATRLQPAKVGVCEVHRGQSGHHRLDEAARDAYSATCDASAGAQRRG